MRKVQLFFQTSDKHSERKVIEKEVYIRSDAMNSSGRKEQKPKDFSNNSFDGVFSQLYTSVMQTSDSL